MAWPTVEELRRALGVSGSVSSDLDAALAVGLGAAIEGVCADLGYTEVIVTDPDGTPAAVGQPEAYDDPDDPPDPVTITPNYSMQQAALLLAVKAFKSTDAPFGVAAVFDAGAVYVARQDPNYRKLLVGNRVRFAVG